MARLLDGAPKELERYLTPQERMLFVIRRHWLVISEPVATAVAGLFVVIFLAVRSSNGLHLLEIAIWVEVAILLRAAWKVLDWWYDRFVATNKRLLLTYGIVTRKVAMMPMGKVTDMSYNRTVSGRVFGYGEFVLESAGQDQALSRVPWVPNPDYYYRVISSEIFAPEGVVGSESVMGSGPGQSLPHSEAESAWWRRT